MANPTTTTTPRAVAAGIALACALCASVSRAGDPGPDAPLNPPADPTASQQRPATTPASQPATRPTTTTDWARLRLAYARARKVVRPAVVRVVAQDGIAVAVTRDSGKPEMQRFRVDARTKVLVPRPAQAPPGDRIEGPAQVVRYEFGDLTDIKPNAQVTVFWDEHERASIVEISPPPADRTVVVGYPPLAPTALPVPATRPARQTQQRRTR